MGSSKAVSVRSDNTIEARLRDEVSTVVVTVKQYDRELSVQISRADWLRIVREVGA